MQNILYAFRNLCIVALGQFMGAAENTRSAMMWRRANHKLEIIIDMRTAGMG
jgi:hypothetical protein